MSIEILNYFCFNLQGSMAGLVMPVLCQTSLPQRSLKRGSLDLNSSQRHPEVRGDEQCVCCALAWTLSIGFGIDVCTRQQSVFKSIDRLRRRGVLFVPF